MAREMLSRSQVFFLKPNIIRDNNQQQLTIRYEMIPRLLDCCPVRAGVAEVEDAQREVVELELLAEIVELKRHQHQQ